MKATVAIDVDELRRRLADIEAALMHQRELTAAERRRADALEAATRRAWSAGLRLFERKRQCQ